MVINLKSKRKSATNLKELSYYSKQVHHICDATCYTNFTLLDLFSLINEDSPTPDAGGLLPLGHEQSVFVERVGWFE